MPITRRGFKLGVVALVVVAAGGARFGAGASLAARLEADLAARLDANPEGAAFTVQAFEEVRGASAVHLRAEVRLDWAPGMRLRALEAGGPTVEAAYRSLETAAVAAFAGVVPGFRSETGAA